MTMALGIEQRPAAAYMPQIQGLTEKFNHTLVKALSHYTVEKPNQWSNYVKFVTFAYNTTVNESLGYSPFNLMFGREPNLPADYIYLTKEIEIPILERIKIIQDIRKTLPKILEKAQEKQKAYFDRNKQDLILFPGDEVLIHFPKNHALPYNKFQPSYRGPYVIKEKINELTYLIELEKHGKIVDEPIHVSRLKLFHKRLEP